MEIYKTTIRLKNGKEKVVPMIRYTEGSVKYDRRMTMADRAKYKDEMIKQLGEEDALSI